MVVLDIKKTWTNNFVYALFGIGKHLAVIYE